MIDPVLVYGYAGLDKEELENHQKLANNAYVYVTQELEKDYQIVKAPEPGTLRIKMAIVNADSAKPVRNTFSTHTGWHRSLHSEICRNRQAGWSG